MGSKCYNQEPVKIIAKVLKTFINFMGKHASKPQQWPLYKSVPLAIDKDGFVKSFNLKTCNPGQVKQFYDNYGIIVFQGILNEEQIEKTIDDLWTQTKQTFQTEQFKIDRNDPKTWNFEGFQKRFGFVGDQPLNKKQIWKNRSNQKVYKAFKSAFEVTSGQQVKQPLIACFQRGSMMRPSKIDSSWETKNIYHFDIDPWHWCGLIEKSTHQGYEDIYREFIDYQYMLCEGNYTPNKGYTKLAGVLALSDTSQQSGGFEAALGFQNYLKKWCQKYSYNTHFVEDQELMATFQKVPMRKGSLMIFSRELPHNIYKNKSQNFRYAQYLRMIPESALCLNQEQKQKRKNFIHPMIPKDLERNEIVKEIFMLD